METFMQLWVVGTVALAAFVAGTAFGFWQGCNNRMVESYYHTRARRGRGHLRVIK